MQVLVLIAPRNGAGRTTLAGRLALQAERAGAGPVVLLDADPAAALSRWAEAQMALSPIVECWDASCAGPEFARLGQAGVGLVVIDAPEPARRDVLEQTLSVADLAAIVVRPVEEDLAGVGGTVRSIEAAGRPFLFVVNRAPQNGDLTTATAIALAQHGTVCPVILPERRGSSMVAPGSQTDNADASGHGIVQLWDYLADRLGRIALEASPAAEPQERRSFPRHSFNLAATFVYKGQIFPCQIQDISAGGLSLCTGNGPGHGARLTLHIPYLGEFQAEIVRHYGDVSGLRFLIDEQRQAGLVSRLADVITSGRSKEPAPRLGESGEDLFVRKTLRS